MHLHRNKHIFIFQNLFLLFILTVFLCPCNASDLPLPSTEQGGLTKRFSSPPLIVDIHFSKNQMTIAESLTVTVSAHLPEDFELALPEFQAALGDFTIKERSSTKKELTDSGLIVSKTWQVEPFLPGKYSIPPLEVSAHRSTNPQKVLSVSTDKVIIPVLSFLDPEEKEQHLADIIPPVSIPENKTLFFIISGVLLLVAGAGLFWFFRRRTPQKNEFMVPCHIEALGAIDSLTKENLPVNGYHKEFFNRLSLILRSYIESRFSLKATEQTTEEFFTNLRGTTLFNQEQKNSLHHFLSRSDLIKFAEATPSDGETDQSLVLCRGFIEQTTEQFQANATSNIGGQP
jgi:LPXTG-motif cell wall-anchored protein